MLDQDIPLEAVETPKQIKVNRLAEEVRYIFFSNNVSSHYFQGVLLAIASAFMFYAEHFKLYSSFCASHSKAQKALHPSKLPFQNN